MFIYVSPGKAPVKMLPPPSVFHCTGNNTCVVTRIDQSTPNKPGHSELPTLVVTVAMGEKSVDIVPDHESRKISIH